MISLLQTHLEGWSQLPRWLQVLCLLVGGGTIAWLLGFSVAFVTRVLFIDRLLDKTRLHEFLLKGNIRQAPSMLLGILVKWLIWILLLKDVAMTVDADFASAMMSRITQVIPELLVAVVIAGIGFMAVRFISNLTRTLARNAGQAHAAFLARCVKWGGYVLVIALSVDQLGFAKALLSPLVLIFFAAVCLAGALAFGLGCKDMAKDHAQAFLKSLRERARFGDKTDLEG